MRKVLLAAYYFPPCGLGGVQRPAKWVKYLPELGWDPVVLTVTPDSYPVLDESLLEELPSGLKVVRDRLRSLPLAGDPGLRWLPALARRVLQQAREERAEVLLLTGSPFFSFLAGPWARKAIDLPYVLDFRDPWTIESWWPESHRLKGRLKHGSGRLAEALAVRGASSCLFAQPGILEAYRDAYPELHGARAVELPNGFDEEEFPEAGEEPPPPPARARFRLVHTGSWVHDRTPELILDALAHLRRTDAMGERIEALFVGHSSIDEEEMARGRGLEDIVRFQPYVPHDRCVEILRQADLLWLENRPRRHTVAGKTFEYLASGRPILAVVHPEGQEARWIEEAGTGQVVSRDPTAVAEALGALLRRLDDGRPPTPRGELVRRFGRRRLTKRLAAALDEAASVRRGGHRCAR